MSTAISPSIVSISITLLQYSSRSMTGYMNGGLLLPSD